MSGGSRRRYAFTRQGKDWRPEGVGPAWDKFMVTVERRCRQLGIPQKNASRDMTIMGGSLAAAMWPVGMGFGVDGYALEAVEDWEKGVPAVPALRWLVGEAEAEALAGEVRILKESFDGGWNRRAEAAARATPARRMVIKAGLLDLLGVFLMPHREFRELTGHWDKFSSAEHFIDFLMPHREFRELTGHWDKFSSAEQFIDTFSGGQLAIMRFRRLYPEGPFGRLLDEGLQAWADPDHPEAVPALLREVLPGLEKLGLELAPDAYDTAQI